MHDAKLQDVLYRTDEAYWQVVSLAGKKRLADAYVQLLEKMNADVEAMIAEGIATKADGLSVSVKLNEAQTAQTKVDNGLALSRMALCQVCGLSLDDTPPTLADELTETQTLPTTSSSADVNTAFANRPELRSLELATLIHKRQEAVTLGKLLPSVTLGANYSVMNPNLKNGYRKSFDGMFHVGVLVNIPLSAWWEGAYSRSTARAQTLISRLQYEDTREKIELQVSQSSYRLEEARKRLAAAERNRERAEENLRMANDGFKEGVIPALNLMEAQTAWVSARSEWIDANINIRLADTYLIKTLGLNKQ
jgi:outer membrane protein TolC